MQVYLNGDYVDSVNATIAVDDRGFLYGDALYESIRIFRGGLFRFAGHWDRLSAGAAALQIVAPPSDEVRAAIAELVHSNNVADGSARITLTRGPGGEGLRTTGSGPPTLLITVRALSEERLAKGRSGFSAIIARSRRSPVGLPSSIKSANRLDAILARLEADTSGVDEAIMLSAEGHVAEGTASNVFWYSGGTLRTPALDIGILPGVTRHAVLEVCSNLGIESHEGRWPADDLLRASEAFVTMSSLGPVLIREIDSQPMSADPTSAFDRVRDAYWALVGSEAAQDPLG